MDLKIQNAIISVSDKTGLVEFAKKLKELGVNIYSTGGTAKTLENVGIDVIKISDYTGFPEILDGRVKSLHPRIHGGILAKRDNENHLAQLSENGIVTFDLVVVNLYPFGKVIQKKDVTIEEAIENIDIGGPSMLRSAAKNYKFVCVVSSPDYYGEILNELQSKGTVSLELRKKLAMEVFEQTAYYDSLISGYFHNQVVEDAEEFPERISFYFKKELNLRYGENPHQKAAYYIDPEIKVTGVSSASQIHGKELSFNNILDLEAAFETVKEFKEPAASVIKHTNPCGVAVGDSLARAFLDAWESDPVSAFGSIIGLNQTVDEETARVVLEAGFVECIIAPRYEIEALELLKSRKNLRILETGKIKDEEVYDFDMKRVVGGILIQERDLGNFDMDEIKCVTEKAPTEEELEWLIFAWKVCKHVKSNAIVLANGKKTVGVGAGQMSRVDATFMAIHKAGERAGGAVLASDAFFPQSDSVELAAEHGIKAIIQPGGSVKDREVIDACNRTGISMVFTSMRHFRH